MVTNNSWTLVGGQGVAPLAALAIAATWYRPGMGAGRVKRLGHDGWDRAVAFVEAHAAPLDRALARHHLLGGDRQEGVDGLQPLDIADGPASPFYDRYGDHVERHLDYLVDTQGTDGAWAPHWSWAGTFPEAWERASVDWKGRLTVGRLQQLAAFGRVEER